MSIKLTSKINKSKWKEYPMFGDGYPLRLVPIKDGKLGFHKFSYFKTTIDR